jgi:hypothetical protein
MPCGQGVGVKKTFSAVPGYWFREKCPKSPIIQISSLNSMEYQLGF